MGEWLRLLASGQRPTPLTWVHASIPTSNVKVSRQEQRGVSHVNSIYLCWLSSPNKSVSQDIVVILLSDDMANKCSVNTTDSNVSAYPKVLIPIFRQALPCPV